jgi:murein DD-endopeptidase MepM/ murein hydrolase activator NlpD
MKGLTLTRLRALLRGVLIVSYACATTVAAAQEICSPVAPCSDENGMPAASADPAARPSFPLDSLAGDGGGRAARPHGPLPTSVAWSSAMDRHDLIVGAIDPDHDDSYEYRLPYGATASFPVIQGYRSRLSHRGAEQYTVDFGMPIGTPVHAARDGVVALAEDSHDLGCWREECGRLANFIVLLHSDGTTGEYFHLQRGSVQVRLGQHVERGELLAFSGNTGYTTAPHLHFGVYRTERDGETQSLAVRFVTRAGMIREPRAGARYLNVAEH